jgi:sodium/potassium-transporting ATPase subunit alpha
MIMAYESPESDILTRGPRKIRSQHLVDRRLLFHAYGFVGILECTCSMTMSFWHMQRRGLPFSAIWLRYGNLDPQYSQEFVTQVVNEGSSVYFVTLVVMYVSSARGESDTNGAGRQFFNLMATRTRRLSLFQSPPIGKRETQNLYLFPAILFALVIAFICNIFLSSVSILQHN